MSPINFKRLDHCFSLRVLNNQITVSWREDWSAIRNCYMMRPWAVSSHRKVTHLTCRCFIEFLASGSDFVWRTQKKAALLQFKRDNSFTLPVLSPQRDGIRASPAILLCSFWFFFFLWSPAPTPHPLLPAHLKKNKKQHTHPRLKCLNTFPSACPRGHG